MSLVHLEEMIVVCRWCSNSSTAILFVPNVLSHLSRVMARRRARVVKTRTAYSIPELNESWTP